MRRSILVWALVTNTAFFVMCVGTSLWEQRTSPVLWFNVIFFTVLNTAALFGVLKDERIAEAHDGEPV